MKARTFIITAGAAFALAAPAAHATSVKHGLVCATKSKSSITHRTNSANLSSALRRPLGVVSSDRLSFWQSRHVAPGFQYATAKTSKTTSCTSSKASRVIAIPKTKPDVLVVKHPAVKAVVATPAGLSVGVSSVTSFDENRQAGSYSAENPFVEYAQEDGRSNAQPQAEAAPAVGSSTAAAQPEAAAPVTQPEAAAPVTYYEEIGS